MTSRIPHIPMRRCVTCRTSAPKETLQRFARDADGRWHLDARGNTPGRGAWMCLECSTKVTERDLKRTFQSSAAHLAHELAGRVHAQPTREA